MGEQAADVMATEVAEAGVGVGVEHQRLAAQPERLVHVHARAVLLEDRLRHECRDLAVTRRGVLDDVLVDHHLVRHPEQRLEAHVDLALAARGDLVVMELACDPECAHRHDHLGAQVREGVGRRDGEVPLLLAQLVCEVGLAVEGLAGVPEPLDRVDLVEGAVLALLVGEVLEDEELGLGPEVAGVGDPAFDQPALGLRGDVTRIARVRVVGERVGDRADQRQRRNRVIGIDDRGPRIRLQQHVGLVDRLESANRGAVESETGLEVARVEHVERHLHVLPGPGQVGELEVDHLDAEFARKCERVVRRRHVRRGGAPFELELSGHGFPFFRASFGRAHAYSSHPTVHCGKDHGRRRSRPETRVQDFAAAFVRAVEVFPPMFRGAARGVIGPDPQNRPFER